MVLSVPVRGIPRARGRKGSLDARVLPVHGDSPRARTEVPIDARPRRAFRGFPARADGSRVPLPNNPYYPGIPRARGRKESSFGLASTNRGDSPRARTEGIGRVADHPEGGGFPARADGSVRDAI